MFENIATKVTALFRQLFQESAGVPERTAEGSMVVVAMVIFEWRRSGRML